MHSSRLLIVAIRQKLAWRYNHPVTERVIKNTLFGRVLLYIMPVLVCTHLLSSYKYELFIKSGFFYLLTSLIFFGIDKSIAQSPTLPTSQLVGIHFFTGSWGNALAEAKRQNKPLYVDIYTTWCPPCQRMTREAFPNSTVGAKFNDYFINYQVNAEMGEGLELVKRYAIASYPTALFVIPTGEIVHRAVGYGGIQAMIEQAELVYKMPQVRRSRRKRAVINESPVSVPSRSTDTVKALHQRNSF